jgi:3-oxo-5-alpha-steroid 4-dehydrogenase 3
MWIGHYLIGLAFYFFTNIAIFVEDIHRLLDHSSFVSLFFSTRRAYSLRHLIAVPIFFIAAYKQHRYHAYLALLEKYTLPDRHAFRYIVAPHYTAECLIYLSLAVLGARPGNMVNGTIFCAFVFVVVNLSVTADGTKRWMLQKFPDRQDDVRKRWRVLPMLF